jgi:DNA replication protein DnaC
MLYLHGGVGLAKTVLLKIACAKWAREERGIFRFTTQKEMIDDIRLGYNDKDEPHRAVKEKEEKYIGFSLLAIDELTAERNTEFKIEEMFHVINKRHEAGVEQAGQFVTVMAGNISPTQLDYRIADRLSDGRNNIVQLRGESYRPAMEWPDDEPEHEWVQNPDTGEWIR